MSNRKYLPTFSELIDRLSIVQLKEAFIPQHTEEYSQEISGITNLIIEKESKREIIWS